MAPLLTVIGDLVEDVVVWSPTIDPGTDNPATVHRCRGGSAANVAVAASASGAATRFIGRVGDDDSGRRLVAELVASGIDVRVQTGGTTGSIVVIVTPDGERTMFPARGASADLEPIDPMWLDGTSVLHVPAYGFVDPRSADVLTGAAAVVHRAGGEVSVDLSAVSLIHSLGPAGVGAMLERLGPSIVFANREEAAAVGFDAVPLPGVTVVIKDGPRPAVVVTGAGSGSGDTITIPVPAVDVVVDTTGAGDAFAGGFLARWMEGQDAAGSVAAGHAAAAAVLARPGAGRPLSPDSTATVVRSTS